MPSYPIDLSRKMSGPESSPVKMDEEYYPSLHLHWDKKYDLPESGTMVVRFKKVSESTNKRDGKDSQDVTLDIQKIVSVKPDEAKDEEESTEEALDRLKEEAEGEEG